MEVKEDGLQTRPTVLLAIPIAVVFALSSATIAESVHPGLREQTLLFVVRHQYASDHHNTATLFQTGEINEGKFHGGSALKTIDFKRGGVVSTLMDVPDGVVRDPEISYDGKRVVFSMRKNKLDDYHIYEMNIDGSALKQLTSGGGVSDIDPAYLPDGSIVFSSTRDYKFCQCNRHIMANLFRMDADGSHIHQIGGNDLFEGHPHVMPDGSILYDRWEYVDRQFGPSFGLWTVNPDGTNHALFYGNNAWSPGMIADARIIPDTHRFVATYGSCHDRPWGAIVVVDRTRGMDGLDPVIHSWPKDISPFLNDTDVKDPDHRHSGRIDAFKRLRVKYEDPFPLSDRHILCSRTVSELKGKSKGEKTGIFLLDTNGDETLIHQEDTSLGCFDPMMIAPRPRPRTVADRTDLQQTTGRFYVTDVYRGAGMERVPRGAIKTLRIVEAPPKLEWTKTFWSIDGAQAPAMNWNVTVNKRILGTVPVEADGSAYFEVPADRFVFFQALDKNGMMIQSMRSGTLVRPGETIGCVGCHENRQTTVPSGPSGGPMAMRRAVSALEPWYGPARNFNYLTEVQPVFDRRCVSCHDYGKPAGVALNLANDAGLVFNTSYLDIRRNSPLRWQPQQSGNDKPLITAVDDGPPQVLPPYAWGSHRSRLVDVLRDDHYGVRLKREEFDRIVTWIDLNAPYYGSYASAYPDNPFGRSPLTANELSRLSKLTGVPLTKGSTGAEKNGSQVNFARPHLSACLSKLNGPKDPRYIEALSIIESGRRRLTERPRADMPGFVPAEIDRERQHKAAMLTEAEAQVRRAIVERSKPKR